MTLHAVIARGTEVFGQAHGSGTAIDASGIKEQFVLEKIRNTPGYAKPFSLETYNVSISKNRGASEPVCEVSVRIGINGEEHFEVSEGEGPVDAFHLAMMRRLIVEFPDIASMQLGEYTVPPTQYNADSAAVTHVSINTKFQGIQFTTVNDSPNVIDASIKALCDAYELCIAKAEYRKKSLANQD